MRNEKNKNIRKKSFTFIEILIVVSIITFFSGLTLATYNNFSEEQRFEVEIKKLIDILSLARKKASSGDLYTSCTNFEGYVVEISSTISYLLKFCCDGSCSTTIQNYSLSSNSFFDSATTTIPTTIQFMPLTTSATSSFITLKNKWIKQCRYVKIESSGVISNNKCTSFDSYNDRCVCP